MMIYAAGGAGCNIASNFLKQMNKETTGMTVFDCVYIDTSRSNLNPNIPLTQTYLVDNLDGSGKLRSSNHQVLSDCSRDILLKHKPADINIVIGSGSGGSGSVISPILVSQLLDRGEDVIVITIGSTSSRIETENTLKTLKSYEMISQLRETPVIMAYRENSPTMPRGKVDAEIEMFIATLAVMFSGNNRELDSSDLSNFLKYQKVTNFKPKLSHLDIFNGNVTLSKGQALVSLVTLMDSESQAESGVLTDYQAAGFIPDSAKTYLGQQLPIHAAVVSGYFNGVAETLEQKIRSYDEVRNAIVEKPITDRNTQATGDGLVL